MLLQFSVENFLSFDAMTTFSMRATDEADHPSHVLQRGAHRAVRGAALYGANAAGKSNIVKAMAYARDLIVSRKGIPLKEAPPFRLGDNKDKPSGFHWQWIHAGQKWSYGFDILGRHVLEEYLFSEPEEGGEEQLWFERKTNENVGAQIELGERLLGNPESDDARLLELLAPRTPTDELFVHRCRDNEIDAIASVLSWFVDNLAIISAEEVYESLILESSEDKKFSGFLSNQMKDVGVGINRLIPVKMGEEEMLLRVNDKEKDRLNKNIDIWKNMLGNEEQMAINGDSIGNASTIVYKDASGDVFTSSLYPIHEGEKVIGGELFHWREESEGTQRYLHLLPRLYRLQTRPTVLIIDELERRLHTKLTRRFVEQSIGIANLPESQLIFTTHDTNLLDNTLLRRDEIWFVDKNESGASSLYSMAEFKDFDSPNYEQAYLMGLFEAIPYFRNSHQLSPALRKTDDTPDS